MRSILAAAAILCASMPIAAMPEVRGASAGVAPIVVAGPGAGGGYEQRIRRKKKKPRSGLLTQDARLA